MALLFNDPLRGHVGQVMFGLVFECQFWKHFDDLVTSPPKLKDAWKALGRGCLKSPGRPLALKGSIPSEGVVERCLDSPIPSEGIV